MFVEYRNPTIGQEDEEAGGFNFLHFNTKIVISSVYYKTIQD